MAVAGGRARPTIAQRLLASAARAPIDLRSLLPAEVLAQGPRPLCVPFALSTGHEALRASENAGKVEALAPEALWWSCTRRGQTGATGVLLSDVGLALADTGQPALEDWPFDDSLGPGTEDPPAGAGPAPWLKADLRAIPLAHDGIEDEVEDWLSRGTPVGLVIEVTQEFEFPDSHGHISTPSMTVGPGEYHAVVAVGVATHQAHGRRLLIRNSWGAGWGLGGYGWLPLAYLQSFAVQACVVVAPGSEGNQG